MSTLFPGTGIDSYSTKTDTVTDVLAAHVNDLQLAVVAIETKVGVDSSAVATSIDYILKDTTSGHNHDGTTSRKVKATDLAVTSLTVSQLLRVNAAGTAIESSGQVLPSGSLVGTTAPQTLTNKVFNGATIDSPTITNAPANILRMTGEVIMWPTSSIPTGWLLCDGSAVSRTIYAALFALLGTLSGSGDGSTTFNLPDYRDRVPVGKSGSKPLVSTGGSASVNLSHSHTTSTGSHILITSEIPSHNHGITDPGHAHNIRRHSDNSVSLIGVRANGNFTGTGQNPLWNDTNDLYIDSQTTGITISNSGSGGGHTHTISADLSTTQTIQNPYLAINFIIKI